MQVEEHLKDKKLSIDREVNARLMDRYGRQVGQMLGAAKKAKRKMRLQIRKIDMNVDLAAATEAFMRLKKNKPKKSAAKKHVERENLDFWNNFGESDKENDVPMEEATARE